MIIFETERLLVRQYEFARDFNEFFRLHGDEEIMRYIRKPKSKEECEEFIRKEIAGYVSNPLMGRWAVIQKQSGVFIGSFAIIPIEGTTNIQLGYALLKEFWGKGFASELTLGGLSYYFNNTDADHIYAIAEKENVISHRVLLKNGFSHYSNRIEGEKELLQFIYKKSISI